MLLYLKFFSDSLLPSHTTSYMAGIDCSKHYIYYPYEGGTIIVSFLQVRKLGHCEVKKLAQVHSARSLVLESGSGACSLTSMVPYLLRLSSV